MASIDSIVAILDTVNDKLDEAVTSAHAAESDADDAISQAMGLSATSLAQGFSIAKDAIEKAISQIAAAKDTVDEAITATRAADG